MIRVFLICFVCCCSSLMPLKQSDSVVSEDHIQVVEKKRIENYYKNSSGYYYYASGDILSTNFFDRFLAYCRDDLGYSWANPNNTNTGDLVIDYTSSSPRPLSTFLYVQSSRSYNSWFSVRAITLKKESWGNSSVFSLRFNGETSSTYIEFQYTIIQGSDTPTLYNFGVDVSNSSGNYDTNYYATHVVITENSSSSSSLLWRLFYDVNQGNYQSGYDNGYLAGYDAGFGTGSQSASDTAYDNGYNDGSANGYQSGYTAGYNDAIDTSSLPATIFTGIVNVGLLPVNVFLQMFNYEVFGVNIAGLISSLLTIAVVIIVIRVVTGKKNA